MSVMRVEVVSNEEHIYSGEASFVVVPTVSGELGIYPRHEPIMSLGGILEVQPDKVMVLADIAVRSTELDTARAEEAKRAAQERLAHAKQSNDDYAQDKAHVALAAAIAELKTLDYLRVHKE